MKILLLLLSQAFAYPEIRPAPMSNDIIEKYRSYQKTNGEKSSALVCQDFAEGLNLCFRYVSETSLAMVHQKDLRKWDATLDQISVSVKDSSLKYIKADRYFFQEMEDRSGGFWASATQDGWDAAGLFHPKMLEDLVGKKVFVAIPQSGMFIFWEQGNPILNKSVAAGVKESYKAASFPISPYIYQWNGEKWVVWGEAIERKE